MNEYETTSEYETTFVLGDPKSMAYIGGESHKIIVAIDQYFNWFQKLMWKWCFGVKIEDCKSLIKERRN